jgi:hypothetical protein
MATLLPAPPRSDSPTRTSGRLDSPDSRSDLHNFGRRRSAQPIEHNPKAPPVPGKDFLAVRRTASPLHAWMA